MKYEQLHAVEMGHVETMKHHGLDVRLLRNGAVFGGLGPDFIANLCQSAVSPFTGAEVPPVEHFGIDSDPWMHSILYKDKERSFVVICQGLTNSGVLGAILLPKERLIFENRDTWYYRDVYDDRIHRNIPRILNFFQWREKNTTPTKLERPKVLASIGNGRVGDYIMQLLWLNKLVNHPALGRRFEIERLLINGASEFMDLTGLFAELANVMVRCKSAAHIEYHSRHFQGPMLSDKWRLSDKANVNELTGRMRHAAHRYPTTRVAGFIRELASCPLRIWLSLELEKRVCRDQHIGLANVLTSMCDAYLAPGESLGLVFSGMTSTASRKSSASLIGIIDQEKQIAAELARRINRSVRWVQASGTTLEEKFLLSDNCDFVLSPIGSASIVPSLLLSKPGLVYGYNAQGYAAFTGDHTVVLDRRHIAEAPDLRGAVSRQTLDYVSYTVDWRAVENTITSNFSFCRDASGRLAVRLRNGTSQ